MSKLDMLDVIKKYGSICSGTLSNSDYQIIKSLEEEGIIETMFDINGKDFFNDHYLYVLKGNPDNIQWVEDNGQFTLRKVF